MSLNQRTHVSVADGTDDRICCYCIDDGPGRGEGRMPIISRCLVASIRGVNHFMRSDSNGNLIVVHVHYGLFVAALKHIRINDPYNIVFFSSDIL